MARRARAALKGAGERLAPDLRDSRRVLSAVSDYLRTKNLWNDPTTGRFIRRGRSEGKSQVIQTLRADRAATVGRLRTAPNRQSRVKLRDSERDLIALNDGADTVAAEYLDDETVTVTIKGRRYGVSLDKIDTSWRPATRTPTTRLTRPAISNPDVPVNRDWQTAGPQAWIDSTAARYTRWTIGDLMDDANQDELIDSVAQMVQDGAWPPYTLERDRYSAVNLAVDYATYADYEMLAAAMIPDFAQLPDQDRELITDQFIEVAALASVAGAFRRDVSFGEDVRSVQNTPVGNDFDAQAAIQYPDINLRVSDEATTQEKMPREQTTAAVTRSPLMRHMVGLFSGPVLTSVDGPRGLGGVATTKIHAGPKPSNTFIGYGDIGPGSSFVGPSVARVDQMLINSIAYGVLDASFDGAVRHEYGHHIDNIYKYASAYAPDTRPDIAARRQAVLDAWANTSSVLGMNATRNDNELIAELWTLISHPDYRAWKEKRLSDGIFPITIEQLDIAESYFNPEGIPFYSVDPAQTDRSIDAVFVPRGVKRNKDGLPPQPGGIPIPDGMIRLYHVTNNDESVRSILSSGLDVAYARGESYGEPNVLWATAERPQPNQPFIEFWVTPDELDIGAPSAGTDTQAAIDRIHQYGSNVTLKAAVLPPDRIVTYNDSYTSLLRDLLDSGSNNPEFRQNVLDGMYDSVADDAPGYGAALERVKDKWRAATPPPPPDPSKSIRRSSVENIDTERLLARMEYLSDWRRLSGSGRIPTAYRLVEKQAIGRELLARGAVTLADLKKYEFVDADDPWDIDYGPPQPGGPQPFNPGPTWGRVVDGLFAGQLDRDVFVPVRQPWVRRKTDPDWMTDLEWRGSAPRMPDEMIDWIADDLVWPTDEEVRFYGHGITDPEHRERAQLGGLVGNNGNGFMVDGALLTTLANEIRASRQAGVPVSDELYVELWQAMTQSFNARVMLQQALENGVSSPQELEFYRLVHRHFNHQANVAGYGDAIPLERIGEQRGVFYPVSRRVPSRGRRVADYQQSLVSFMRQRGLPRRDKLDADGNASSEPDPIDELPWYTETFGARQVNRPLGRYGYGFPDGKLRREDILGAFGDTPFELIGGPPGMVQQFLRTGEPQVTREFDNPFYDDIGQRLSLGDTVTGYAKLRGGRFLRLTGEIVDFPSIDRGPNRPVKKVNLSVRMGDRVYAVAARDVRRVDPEPVESDAADQSVDALLIDGVRSPWRGMPNADLLEAEAVPVIGLSDPDSVNGISRVYETVLADALATDPDFAAAYMRAVALNTALRRQVRTGVPFDDAYQAVLADDTLVPAVDAEPQIGSLNELLQGVLVDPNPDPALVGVFQRMRGLYLNTVRDRPVVVQRVGDDTAPFTGPSSVTSWSNVAVTALTGDNPKWEATVAGDNVVFPDGAPGRLLVAADSRSLDRLMEGPEAAPFVQPADRQAQAIDAVRVDDNRFDLEALLAAPPEPLVSYDTVGEPEVVPVTFSQVDILVGRLDAAVDAAAPLVDAGARNDVRLNRSGRELLDRGALLNGLRYQPQPMEDRPTPVVRNAQRNRDTAEAIVRRTQDELAAAVGPDGRVVLYRATPTLDDPFRPTDGDAVGTTSWTTNPEWLGPYLRYAGDEPGAGIVAASIPIQQILAWDDVGLMVGDGDGREVIVASTPEIVRRAVQGERPALDQTQIDLLAVDPESGLPEWGERYIAAVRNANRNDRLDRDDVADYRIYYQQEWKNHPKFVREAAFVAGGLAPPPNGFRTDEAPLPLMGATLYNDLVDSVTTAAFPLFRGDPTAADRTIGERFIDIRGFSGSQDVARSFGGWQYRIEPGDATVVATYDDLSDPASWDFAPHMVALGANEAEVIVGGTFEVTAVDAANRVVTIRQVEPLPESPLARRVEQAMDAMPAPLDQPERLTKPDDATIRATQIIPSTAVLIADSESRRASGGVRQQENTSVYPIDVLEVYRADDDNPVAVGTVAADSTVVFEPVRAYRGMNGQEPPRRIPRTGETVDIYRDLGQGRAHKRGYPDNDAFSVRMAGQTPVQASTIGVELTRPRVAWDAAAKATSESDPNNQRSVHGFLRGDVARYLTPVEAAVLVQQPGWQEVTYYPGTEDFFLPATRERVIGGDRAVASLGKFYLLNPRVVAGSTTPVSVIEGRARNGIERRIGKRPAKGKAAQQAWDQLRSVIGDDPSSLSIDLLTAPRSAQPPAVAPLRADTVEPTLPGEIGASVRPTVSATLIGDFSTLSRHQVINGLTRSDVPAVRDDVRRLIRQTQAALGDAAVDRVVLYRGVAASEAAAPWGLTLDPTLRMPDYRKAVGLTSWTTDRQVAEQYARITTGGVVVKAVVPRNQIVSWDAIGNQRDSGDVRSGREVLVAATPDMLTSILAEDEPLTIDALQVAAPQGTRVPDGQFAVYATSEVEPTLDGELEAAVKPVVPVDPDSPLRTGRAMDRTLFRDTLTGRRSTDTAAVARTRDVILGTQQALQDAGIDSVVLYRGVPADEADDPFRFLPSDRLGATRRSPTIRESSGLTSWTTDRRVAAKYGKRVVKAVVPRELIVSWDSVGAKARPVGTTVDDGLPGNEVLVVRSSDIVDRFFDSTVDSVDTQAIDLLLTAPVRDYRAVVAERALIVDDLIDAIRSGEFGPSDVENANAEFRAEMLALIGEAGPVSEATRYKLWHGLVHHPVVSRPMVNTLLVDPDPDPLMLAVLRQVRAEMQAELGDRRVEVSRRVWPDSNDPFSPGSSPWFWRAAEVAPGAYPDTGVTSWFLSPALAPDVPVDEELTAAENRDRQQMFMEDIAPLSDSLTITVEPEQVLGRWGRAGSIGEVLVARDASVGDRLDRGEFPLAGPDIGQSIDLLNVSQVGWADAVQEPQSVVAPGTRSTRITSQSTIHSVRLADGRLVMVSTRLLSLPVEDRPAGLQDVQLIDGSASFVMYGPDGIRLEGDGLTEPLAPVAGENGAAFVERAKLWALQSAQTPVVQGAEPLAFDTGELQRLYDDSLGHQIVQIGWPRPTESFVASIQTLVQDNPVAVRMGDEAFTEMLTDDPSPSIRNVYDPAIDAADYQLDGYLSSRDAYDRAVGLRDRQAVHGYMAFTGTVTGDAFPSRMDVAQSVLMSTDDPASVDTSALSMDAPATERSLLIDSSEADRYGAVQIVLKDTVKTRSYFTTADSLDSLAVPLPVLGEIPRDAAATQLLNPMSYVEVQVPGPIPVSEFAEVRLPDDDERLNEIADALSARSFGDDVDFAVIINTPDGDVRYTLGEFIDAYGSRTA